MSFSDSDALFEIIVSNTARKSAKEMPDNLKAKLIDLLDILERNAFPVEEYDIKKAPQNHIFVGYDLE